MSERRQIKSRLLAAALAAGLPLSGGWPTFAVLAQTDGTVVVPGTFAPGSDTVSPYQPAKPGAPTPSTPPTVQTGDPSLTSPQPVLATATPQPSPTATTKVASEAGTIEELKLPNGLKVLMLPDKSFPVFSCMVFYRVGSRNENLGESGLSHLVEHLLFEKVGKFRKGEIGALVARNGGMFNGFTSDDFTCFFETLSPSKLDLALRIESERMKAGSFSAEEVQAEIKRIDSELEQEAKDPVNTLNKEVRSSAFQRHPYKNPTIGWRSDVQKLTVEDARRHYKEYYQPSNATLVLVGDFNAPGAAAAVKKYFGGIAAGAGVRPLRVTEPTQTAERRVVMKYGNNADVVSLAYHAPAFLDTDTAAVAVLEKLLLSGVGGRLRTKLVDGKICSSVRCSFEVKHDPGLFTVNLVGASGVPAQKITESFEQVIDQLKNAPVSDTELRRARNHAEYYVLTERDGPYRTAFELSYFDSLDTWQAAFSAYSHIRSVTAADIQRVAKKYFTVESRVVGVLSGKGTAAAGAAAAKKDAAKDKEKDKDGKDKGAKEAKDDKEAKSRDAKSKDGKSADAKDGKAGDSKFKEGKSKGGKDDKNDKARKKKSPDGAHSRHRRHTASSLVAPQSLITMSRPTLSGPFNTTLSAYKADDAALPELRLLAQAPKLPAARPAAKNPTAPYVSRVKKAVLKNGLTIGVLETKLSPLVQIVGAVKAGEAFEPVGKRGAGTLLAQLMNDGSTKYSRAQATTLQDDLGIPSPSMVRFESGPQWINFQARCLSRDTATVVNVLTSALKSPSMKDEDVDHAKTVVEEHIKHSPDTVKARVNRALLRGLIAPNTSFYPLDPNDKAKFVSNLKSSDVRDFHAQAVKPDAATIVFVGDISLAQATDLAERACEGWNGKSTAKKVQVQPNPRRLLKSSLIVDRREDTMVTLGRLVDAGLGSADYPLLLLADCALTNHPLVSRFAQKISGELSLSSSLSLEDLASDVESLPGTTLWSVDVPVVSNLMPVAVKTIQNELKLFAKSGLTPDEYREVSLYMTGALPVRWMSNSPLAARTSLEALMLDNQADPLPELLTGIGLANVDILNRFIKMTFKPDRSSVVIAGTKQAIGQVHGLKDELVPDLPPNSK